VKFSVLSAMKRTIAVDTAFWRRLAYAGARYGPELWLRHSPAFFGAAFAVVLGRERRAVRENLRAVLGPRHPVLEQLDVFRTFVGYARCLAEGLAAGRPEMQQVRRQIHGRPHLDALVSAGRGALLVTAHAGPWDAAAGLLSNDFAADVMVVMWAERDARARALHDEVRQKSGVRVLHVGAHPLDALPLLRHLRAGGLAAAQLDRVAPGQRALQVSLFGRQARLPEGLFALSALANVPILPVFVQRARYLEYEFVISEPIELPRRPSQDELKTAAQRAATALERFIFAHPTQWFQFEPLD
jgi:KDO2-lipid IV(A) lauroyltransferase